MCLCRSCESFYGHKNSWRCFCAQYAADHVPLPLLFHEYLYDTANMGFSAVPADMAEDFRSQLTASFVQYPMHGKGPDLEATKAEEIGELLDASSHRRAMTPEGAESGDHTDQYFMQAHTAEAVSQSSAAHSARQREQEVAFAQAISQVSASDAQEQQPQAVLHASRRVLRSGDLAQNRASLHGGKWQELLKLVTEQLHHTAHGFSRPTWLGGVSMHMQHDTTEYMQILSQHEEDAGSIVIAGSDRVQPVVSASMQPQGSQVGGNTETHSAEAGAVGVSSDDFKGSVIIFAPACRLHEMEDQPLFNKSHIQNVAFQDLLHRWFWDDRTPPGVRHVIVDQHVHVQPDEVCLPGRVVY